MLTRSKSRTKPPIAQKPSLKKECLVVSRPVQYLYITVPFFPVLLPFKWCTRDASFLSTSFSCFLNSISITPEDSPDTFIFNCEKWLILYRRDYQILRKLLPSFLYVSYWSGLYVRNIITIGCYILNGSRECHISRQNLNIK